MGDYIEFILIGIAILGFVIRHLWESSVDKRAAEITQAKEYVLKREFDTKQAALEKELEKKEKQLRSEYEKKIGSVAQKELRLNGLISRKEEIVNQGITASIASGLEKAQSLFYQYPVFEDLKNSNPEINSRLHSAVTDKMLYLTTPIVSADIQGKTGVYHVTLGSCSCPDYQMRHIPCKHMYRLALQVGLLAGYDSREEMTQIQEYQDLIKELTNDKKKLTGEVNKLSEKKKVLESSISEIKKDAMGSSWLSVQMADLEYLIDMKIADRMVQKARPAYSAAEEKRITAREKREWMAKAKALEYKLAFFESLDPSLSNVSEYTPEEVSEALAEEMEDGQKYLPEDEYNQLSESEKWQLALDRWRARHRSNWQVGRDFERYIGYLYELDGYRVEYFGALEGKMDLGRDLIARKKKEIVIIQCKRWADRKTIHEKHVFQLFGSVVGYEMEHPGSSPKGLLITTCPLSDVAIAYADRLGIDYKQNYPANDVDAYPLIKCNVGQTGEKIFHLPFDQQYDRVTIDQRKGEFYASTVQEAIDAGFRRAYRWHGQ